MKRSLLTALASAAIATTAFAPVASAQSPLDFLNAAVAGADCITLETALTTSGVKGDATTRSQLVDRLHSYAGDNVQLKIMLSTNVTEVADRAVSCGIVTNDSALPAGSAQFGAYADMANLIFSLRS